MEAIPQKLENIADKKRLKELEASGEYLFHGSPASVDTFEPRQAYTDINGEPTPDS